MDLALILKIAGLVAKYGPAALELVKQFLDALKAQETAAMQVDPVALETEVALFMAKVAAILHAKVK